MAAYPITEDDDTSNTPSPATSNKEINTVSDTTIVTRPTVVVPAVNSAYTPAPRRQSDLTIEAAQEMTLGAMRVGLFNDLTEKDADGKRHMAFYDKDSRSLTGPSIVFTTFRDMYEKKFWDQFNAHMIERNEQNFLNYRSMGRALAVVEGYDAYLASPDFIAAFPTLEGASAVIVFISKTDSMVIRAVRFDGLQATTYMMDYDYNRALAVKADGTVGTQVHITNRYLRLHPVAQKNRDDAEKWNNGGLVKLNESRVSEGKEPINPINIANLRTKFEYASYLSQDIRLIVPVSRTFTKDVDTETGVMTWNVEALEAVQARIENGRDGAWSPAKHILYGYIRETLQIAGVRRNEQGELPAETE